MTAVRATGAYIVPVAPSYVGEPDFYACVNGRFVGLEVKLPSGKHPVSRRQKYVGKQIRAAAGTWGVVRSIDEALALINTAEAGTANPPRP